MAPSKNNTDSERFWFGFALGTTVCAGIAAAFGTKQGRNVLRSTIDRFESLENNPKQAQELILMVQELSQTYSDLRSQSNNDTSKDANQTTPSGSEPATHTAPAPDIEDDSSSSKEANQVLEKVKTMTGSSTDKKKSEKKFFTKNKKK